MKFLNFLLVHPIRAKSTAVGCSYHGDLTQASSHVTY